MVAVFTVLGNTSQIRLWNTTFNPPLCIRVALMYWNWKKLLLTAVSFDSGWSYWWQSTWEHRHKPFCLQCRSLQVQPAAKLSTYPRRTQSETGHWNNQPHKAPWLRAAFSMTHIKHRQLRPLPYLSPAGCDKKFTSEVTYTHSWILWAAGMAPLSIHLPTCWALTPASWLLLTGWASVKLTAHSQHSHTRPLCTLNKQVPLGALHGPLPVWNLAWAWGSLIRPKAQQGTPTCSPCTPGWGRSQWLARSLLMLVPH